jgi:hypothetical protein
VGAGALSAPAPAVHTAKSCGKLAGYNLKAQNVGCRFARRWANRSFHSHRKPSGWRCSYASKRSTIRMFCSKSPKAYFLRK